MRSVIWNKCIFRIKLQAVYDNQKIYYFNIAKKYLSQTPTSGSFLLAIIHPFDVDTSQLVHEVKKWLLHTVRNCEFVQLPKFKFQKYILAASYFYNR